MAVVVDVLSFTTTLTVAVERGMTVFPFPWKDDDRAAAYAAARDAVLAVGRFEAREAGRGVSLSPAAMAAVSGVERVVLPSPNGSSISTLLAGSGARVVGACLRNAAAVARWLSPQVEDGATVLVVASGERWPDGSLRPAVEDLWGAGAVLAGLPAAGFTAEARSARAAYDAVLADLGTELLSCASGLELVDAGFADDVVIAGQVGVSEVVPVLHEDRFLNAV